MRVGASTGDERAVPTPGGDEGNQWFGGEPGRKLATGVANRSAWRGRGRRCGVVQSLSASTIAVTDSVSSRSREAAGAPPRHPHLFRIRTQSELFASKRWYLKLRTTTTTSL